MLMILADLRVERVRYVRKPQSLAMLWDCSLSMVYAGNTPFSPADILQSRFYRNLRAETEVHHIVNMSDPEMVSEVQLRRRSCDEPFTDCSKLLRFSEAQAAYRQVILISDGRSYLGEALDQIRLSKEMTVHTIGVGDTLAGEVPVLQYLNIPEHISAGDTVDVRWVIYNPSGKPLISEMILKEDDSVLQREQIDIAPRHMREFPFTYIAESQGVRTWDWSLRDEDGEQVFATHRFPVAASRIRVLCHADPPDRDIAMVSTVLSPLPRYELFRSDAWDRLYPGEKPDLLVQTWHPVHQPRLVEDVPAILFYRHSEDAYRSEMHFSIRYYRPYLLFAPDIEQNALYWTQLPPVLVSPYPGNATTVMESASGHALILEDPSQQAIIINGAGLWRWQLAGYQKAWDGIYRHLIEGLSEQVMRSGKRSFISLDKEQYTGTRYAPVALSVRLPNPELLGAAQVSISVLDTNYSEVRRVYPEMGPRIAAEVTLADSGTYYLIAAIFSEGKEIERDTANLFIAANELETRNPGCDADILRQLSNHHHGRYVHLDEIDSLTKYISTEKVWANVSSMFIARHTLLLYVLMFVMLCADWILRKRYGGM